jgi:hypothetical protein
MRVRATCAECGIVVDLTLTADSFGITSINGSMLKCRIVQYKIEKLGVKAGDAQCEFINGAAAKIAARLRSHRTCSPMDDLASE